MRLDMIRNARAVGRSRLAPAALIASFVIASVSFAAGVNGQNTVAAPPAAIPTGTPQIVWLEQGWSDEERQRFHHQSQGTQTLPIETSWFLALEVPKADAAPPFVMFSDPAYLQRFGFIPSPAGSWNKDGLPVGFARTTGKDPATGNNLDALGFTCAACHTARIDYQGTTMLVDGGPAMTDLQGFGTKLALALGETVLPTTQGKLRFRRFADRVLGTGPGNNGISRALLYTHVVAILAKGFGDTLQSPTKGNVTEGYGRLDALNRIGNTVFGGDMGIPQNRVAITAPVAYPHIWDTSWFTWVQYNGSIEQPMIRNAGEAMGVNAIINFKTHPTPRFTSTIPVNSLYDPIERSVAGATPPLPAQRFSGLRAPAWPEAILGRIDSVLAARGAELYRAQCQACHLAAPNTPDFWTSARWTPANAAGERYLDLLMVPIATIGTDPAQAEDMASRTVLVPAELGLIDPPGPAGIKRKYSFGPALGAAVEHVVNRWYDAQTPPTSPADRERMNGYRPNGIRALLAYKARPLDGIWATAPYLHNGAVPTLWDLLSPYRERPSTFSLGTTTFDPVKVGYINAGASPMNTAIRGNRNGGHLFDSSLPALPGTIGAELSPDDRRALVEYLKTL
ncbi:di-heme-cytochrome C peroxidase [Sphingomonas sp. AR_OL41]|uniref:di-heme-cytochrome C peroxidase n=1 Tax=Sphingomonas sp. AR_OL41 TaxID=3042729 RepID=UPI00247FC0C9|nr:di-heme-cytochrome C peroxidase [Sphingomonas sp. AR_OL41]MDH7972637.1 di-heme-cytochrome C peroxidase [Sphingomonas sp. AR_OL41]